MADAERAIERIYEDESLTDEMMDDEAKVLLRWSEDTVVELDSDAPDDDTFDARFKQMRKLMKRINKFIGQRSSVSDEEAQEMVEKFRSTAADMGHEISEERVQQFMVAQKTLSNTEAVKAMLALLKPDEGESAAPSTEKTTEEKRNVLQNLIDGFDDNDENTSDADPLWDKRI